MTRVEKVIKNLLCEITKEELDEFFYTTFEKPLLLTLVGDETKPAETIRHQLQQTTKIKNILLTLKDK